MNRRLRAALAFGLACGLAAGAAAADIERGHRLYDGRAPLVLDDGRTAPACEHCHRPSGLGNFEGGLAVPPIAGPVLFAPWNPDTARFFVPSARYRVRPAYDEASLGILLRDGRAPDGLAMRAAMPRYAIGAEALADLAAYLRQLSSHPPPGLDAQRVRVATVSTPEADPVRRAAMLATLQRFVELKNGQSRHEVRRAEQSARTREMAMNRKFRVWELVHWPLQGEPDGWAAQLEAHQRATPAYAVLAGMGGASWWPVDEFCGRHRLPCLLPIVGAPAAEGRQSLRFHAGLGFDAALAARALRAEGLRRYRWAEGTDAPTSTLVARSLAEAGLVEHAAEDAVAELWVSTLSPAAHAAWLQRSRPAAPVLWLPGPQGLGEQILDDVVRITPGGWIVTPMAFGAALERQLQRSRLWQRSQGLDALPSDVVASALFAATAFGEGMTHIDFAFTPEYLLELLEHGVENLVPWSPYPRLALGPGQRVASKGSWLGRIEAGSIEWRWEGRH